MVMGYYMPIQGLSMEYMHQYVAKMELRFLEEIVKQLSPSGQQELGILAVLNIENSIEILVGTYQRKGFKALA